MGIMTNTGNTTSTYSIHDGFRIDGHSVKFWSTKRDAVAAAKQIGWPVKAVEKVHTRFCGGYALMGTFGDLVTRDRWAQLVSR